MKRELHVRFCEGFGVKLPLPTRQTHSFHVNISSLQDSKHLFDPINPFNPPDPEFYHKLQALLAEQKAATTLKRQTANGKR